MKLILSTPIRTDELAAIFASVNSEHMLNGTVYEPFMQLLIAPSQDNSIGLVIYELMQKCYAAKDSPEGIELSEAEVKVLKDKLAAVVFPWLKARLLTLLN